MYKQEAEQTHSATIVSEESEIKADERIDIPIFSLILITSLAFVLLEC